jgi:hypothetical protein
MALFGVVFLGSTPIGAPLLGFVCEHQGARAGLAVGAVAAMLAGLAAIAQAARFDARPRVTVRAARG